MSADEYWKPLFEASSVKSIHIRIWTSRNVERVEYCGMVQDGTESEKVEGDQKGDNLPKAKDWKKQG